MRIVFVGPPGAGKGTQALRLCSHFGIPHVSTGETLRRARDQGDALGQLVAPLMDSGKLVCDDLVVKVVGNRLRLPDCQSGFLLDGFPRTLPQAEALDCLLQEFNWKLDGVIEIRVPRADLIRRLVGRATETDRPRADDSLDAIPKRLEVYEEETRPLLSFYESRGQLTTINGVGSPEDVFDRIVARLKQT